MSKEVSAGNRFGEIAVREGFASRQHVQECLDIQAKLKSFGVEPKRLGEIMVEKGFLRTEDVKAILDVQKMGGSRMESRSGIISDVGGGRRGNKASQVQQASSITKDVPAIKSIPGYEVLELLGEGGMGMVYKARQKSLDRIVALKVLPARAAKETAFIKRFISEARTVARLNHENIIAGIDVGEHDGTYYFAMEHVEGESVAQMIDRVGALEERLALQIVAQMARALAHAHKHGLVHRDVKPQNILVTKSGLAKLCDLGLAKMQNDPNSKDPQGVPVGTPHYLSPEQARGEADVDIRSDIYSLGASLYHMLTGTTPFEGQSPMVLMTKHLTEEPVAPRKKNAEVSKAANDLVLRMMSKDKDERYQTPTELLEEVERVLAGKKATTNRSGRRTRKKQSGSNRAVGGDSQEPDDRPSGRNDEEAPARRPRPRMRFIRGASGNSLTMVVVPAIIILVAVGAVIVFQRTSQPIIINTDPAFAPSNPDAAAILKDWRARQLSDPAGARVAYQDVMRRWPHSAEAATAKDWIEQLDQQ